jgi:uncharacterized repeat protein (TIGR01451 family)
MSRFVRYACTLAVPVLMALGLAVAPASAQIVRNFTPRFTTNDRGDIALIGNTLMSCSGAGQCNNARAGNGSPNNQDDNDFNMQYVDVDALGSTFCSSAAVLSLPAGSTVLWAGLYWGGSSANAARNQAQLSTPVAANQAITATQLDASGNDYQGYRDVTALVTAGGNGTYMVANVQSTPNTTNMYAGWALVVAYRLASLPQRNIVAWDGYANVSGATVSIPVSGFVTPPGGTVNTRMGVVAYEGDIGLTGDSFSLNGVAQGNALNPTTNFFNSSITSLGVAVTSKAPNYVNQLGFDIDLLALVNALPNSSTSATISLTTSGDQYFPGVVTFSTDLYAPVITGNSFKKTVVDLNGAPARPGDVLEYTIAMLNTGDDSAIQTVFRDTLPANATFVPGSISVLSGANVGAKTDAAADDQAEYVAASRSVVARLGTGANAASGGSLAPGVATSLRFRVTIGSPSPTGSTVSNQAALAFTGAQTGSPFASLSDGDTTTAGIQRTITTVTAPVISGRVFEDVNYGGGAGRSLAASAGVLRPGARVELYSSAGAWLAADTTDAAGFYSFDGWAAASFTVRVVNSMVTSSRPGAVAGLLPVQTFRTDATTGTAVADPTRVGGEIPARADAAANLASATLASLTTATTTAQSTAPVTLGTSDISAVDFGFNFDVIVNANETGQGSLRQFMTNANTLGNAGLAQVGQTSGVETSIFMVSDGVAHAGLRAGLANLLTGGVVAIAPVTTLPALTDASTRVDGTTQTTNVGDTNAGTLSPGASVGVDALAVPAMARPEVEVRDGAALALGFDLQGSSTALVGLAIYGFGNTPGNDAHANVRVGAAAASVLIDRCALGTSASALADPGAAARSGGDNLRAVGGDGGTVRDCVIGYAAGSGVALTAGSNTWTILENDVRGNAIGQPARDGIGLEASGSATVRVNRVDSHAGVGIDARTATGSTTLENNTVTNSGTGTGAAAETPGIRLGGATNRADRNVISTSYGAGILVIPTASSNTLTRNSIFSNGTILNAGGGGPSGQIGIDLLKSGDDEALGTSPFVTLNDNGDGDAGANGLLNYAVLETAVLSNGSFTLTGWARPGSIIELFVAAADPSGFGEGRTYVATFTEGSASDLDAGSSSYSGAVNGIAQGGDNTNRFRFTLAAPGGVSPGVALTATATLASATSEFSGLVTVTSGVSVAGIVYADADHDFQRDAGEAGTGVALFAKLVPAAAPLAAQAVTAVSAATGVYAFTFVPSGSYSIVLDDNATATDVTPTPPAGWIPTEAAPGVRTGVTVAAADVNDQDLGLYHGSRIDGRVFRDDGAGAGVANDGTRQAGETGSAGVRVRLGTAACAGGQCDSTLSGAAGAYTLWLPSTAAGSVQVSEVNPAAWISTGGNPGTSGGSYARATDAITFTAVAGLQVTGLDFGDVPPNQLVAAGTRTAIAGSVVFYPHTFTAGSAGTVTFTVSRVATPAISGWSADLYRDLDCDGTVDPGEPAVVAPFAVSTGQTVCLVLRHTIPAGAPSGARDAVTIGAGFGYVNAAPALASAVQVGDLTTASDAGGLEIVKSVDVTTARPGDYIRYTITYRNPGADPLTSIVIRDATPAYTVFDTATCVSLGNGLTGCVVTTAPAAGATGTLAWSLSGALAPGASGSVSFRVRVQ